MSQSVKYELQEIERIISEGEAKSDIKKTSVSSLDNLLKEEVERIKKTLVNEVFSFDDERHLERYIQFHQMALIGLLDKLNNQIQLNRSKRDFFQTVYSNLDTVLRFIERHFSKYFDQDSKAPEGYLALARKDAKEHIDKLSSDFSSKGADEKIVFLLLQVLQNIVESKSERNVTFRKVMYAKEVQKELYQLLDRQPTGDINEELRQIMYYLNYNSVKVVTYHAHYISSLLDRAETRTEKIEKLSLVLKNVSQAQVKPAIRYNQNAPSLKDQLSEYISVEMEYQERLQRLNSPSTQRPDSPLSGFKLKFEASVSQLAYLLKVFLETKLISNNNLTEVLQFWVMYAITKKSEGISFSSFRTKFYNVETGTKLSVRNMLTSMINYIDRSQ